MPEKNSPGLDVMSDTAKELSGGPVIELRPVPHPPGKPYSIAPDHEAPKADPIDLGAFRPGSAAAGRSNGAPGEAKRDAGEARREAGEAKREAGEARRDAGEAKRDAGEGPRKPAPRLHVEPPNRAERLRQDGVRERQAAASQRRPPSMAALMVMAACFGSVSGALATVVVASFATSPQPAVVDNSATDAALRHLEAEIANLKATASAQPAVVDNSATDAEIKRIDGAVAGLKADVERVARIEAGQFSKTSERIERIEKAQADPLAKLARLTEAVDKLRVTGVAPAAREITAAVPPAPAVAPAPASAPAQPESGGPTASARGDVGRLPVLEGWRLEDAGNGTAVVEGHGTVYQVFVGDPLPGLGRVDAIRRQDGHWMVVTNKGLIVSH